MEEKDNATWLFEKPTREFHSAEAWWTSFFTIFAFYMQKSGKPLSLQVYRIGAMNDLEPESFLDLGSMSYQNTVVDARLKKEVFGIKEWPNQFLDIKPDITLLNATAKKSVVFIEVKTIGTSVKRNVLLYPDLRDHMRKLGWQSDLFYLMSDGHEETSDWSVLRKTDSRILLWEDVFKLSISTPFETLLGEGLLSYTR